MIDSYLSFLFAGFVIQGLFSEVQAMTSKKRKTPVWFETKVFIRCFMLSALLNGAMSNGVSSNLNEIQAGNQGYQLIMNETVTSVSRGPAVEAFHRMYDDHIEEGVSHSGRSLRFRLGERFAFRKRLQFALLPIMYKMGVMTTLLTGLTVLVLKGLTIGVILLIFAFGNYFSKLHKHSYQSAQPIHVHVHSQDGHKVSSYPSVVGPWDRVADEVHPAVFLGDDELESYRRRLIENSAAMVKFKPLILTDAKFTPEYFELYNSYTL